MINHNKFIKEIKQTIDEVKIVLEKRQKGIQGDGSIDQLQMILQNLERIMYEVISGNVPPKINRMSSMGWFITDSWSLSSPLGEKIIEIEHKYKELN
jgi:hypothetical protein